MPKRGSKLLGKQKEEEQVQEVQVKATNNEQQQQQQKTHTHTEKVFVVALAAYAQFSGTVFSQNLNNLLNVVYLMNLKLPSGLYVCLQQQPLITISTSSSGIPCTAN